MLSEAATSKYAQAGPLRVHYNEAGSGEPLVFCIGQGAGTSAWVVYHRVVEALAQNYRCLLIDQPGYGKSDPVVVRGESRSTMYARTVRDVLDALGIDAVTMVDMSFGAQTAQAFAVDYPGRAKRLVLHASGVGGPSLFGQVPMASHAFVAMYAAFADPSVATMRGMMNAFLYNGAQYSDDDLMLAARVDAWTSRPELDEARRASENVQRDLSAQLGSLILPVLQMHGRNDLIAPLENALRLFNYLPNSRLVLFSQCGHWIPIEKPDEFARYVTDFVQHG
jgi:2-hydroxy-6-oxonona-2,4-dienedioate hydrolase